MNNAVNEIKDRLSIEDLVSQYVQLKKMGRNFKGLCPFHSEKTPSFIVSPDKQIAYCFGCNKGGDIFKFIQEVEGVDFADAIKILAEKTGVKLEEHKAFHQVEGSEKEQLYSAYEKTTQFYTHQLWETEDGQKVLDYLRKRGITDESIKLFRLGLSPDSFDATYNHLIKLGFSKKLLVMGGLAVSKETTMQKIYDRFRGRLMFPILDHLGRVVAFGGRALAKDQEPKYLNSPESVIYHKSNILYGYNLAKPFIKESCEAMIVEGYMDVIASSQAGVKNVVAPCGTALASTQVRILKPFVERIILAFDTDLAGQEAIKRGFEIVQPFELQTYVINIPEGKDPAEYVNQNGNLKEVVEEKILYGDALYSKLLQVHGTTDIAAKKRIILEFLPFFQQLNSAVEKDGYIRKLASDLNLKEDRIYDEIRNIHLPAFHPAKSFTEDKTVYTSSQRRAEEIILGLLIEYPRIGKMILGQIKEDFFDENLKPIYNNILGKYNSEDSGSGEVLIGDLPHELKEKAGLLSLYVSEKYGEMGEEEVEKELNALIKKMNKEIFNRKAQGLKKALMEAENQGNKESKESLMQELSNLYREIG